MRCLVTGFGGQLGYDVINELKSRGYDDVRGIDVADLDITKREDVLSYVKEYNPDVIFHCAAYTAVDKAEENKELCYNVNVNGTKNLIDGAKEVDAKIIYISTDYVFKGDGENYHEVDDEKAPINYYGETKFLGEELVREYEKHYVVRISWAFGINGGNFIKTMLKLSETRDEISVVSDQIGSPTYTYDLAKLLVDMSERNKYGTYHATNEGLCSWYEFAKYIFESNNIDMKVNPVLTKDYKTLAKRPLNSRLSKEKLVENGFEKLPTWQNAVDRYNKVLKKVKEK